MRCALDQVCMYKGTKGILGHAAAHLKHVAELPLPCSGVPDHDRCPACAWCHILPPAEVLQLYAEATGTPLLAVAGNVDDKLDAADAQLLPQHRLMQVAGWRLLVCHIVAPGPTARGELAGGDMLSGL